VLPPAIAFENPDIQRISAALMEDIIAGLSRFRSFSVFAPHTSLVLTQFGSRGTSRPGFDVHYQVNSSIAPSQSGLRANFRLMRGDDGKVIWSIERAFELDKLPVLFSGVCHQIIYSIAEAVEVADRHLPFAARDASAYRCYLEGRNAMAGTGLEGLRAARRWFRRSLELTSNFAPSIAGISRTLTMEKLVRGITDDEMLRQALALADQACATDPFDGRGLRERGFTSLYLKRHDESLESFRDAVAINPNDADLFADYADALTHSGKSQEALAAFSKAMALNPFCPDYYHWILGSIYFQTEDYPAAIAALRPVCGHPETARLLAACHAMNGQLEEARSYAAILKENYPRFRVEEIMHIVPDKLESDISRLTEGLRRAGMP
jgi:tetratricopeptide (TPR) repeat protein